jgi:hypothetical protein
MWDIPIELIRLLVTYKMVDTTEFDFFVSTFLTSCNEQFVGRVAQSV